MPDTVTVLDADARHAEFERVHSAMLRAAFAVALALESLVDYDGLELDQYDTARLAEFKAARVEYQTVTEAMWPTTYRTVEA